MITNATIDELEAALRKVNEKYEDNITFKTIGWKSKNRRTFTLTVVDSRGKGGRRGRQGQRVKAACWHVHGDFFDALFEINEDAFVNSGFVGKITKS